MKKIKYTIMMSVMVLILSTMNVYAMPYYVDGYTSVDEVSKLLPPGVKQSRVTESTRTRGDFFMKADLVIKDDGNGDIGALAVAYTAVPVDEAYITIYLDQWDEVDERWRQVDYYEAEFYASDYPDGLTAPTVNTTFKKQKKGYYYRLRGIFGVMYNNEYEGFTPVTDGILIE